MSYRDYLLSGGAKLAGGPLVRPPVAPPLVVPTFNNRRQRRQEAARSSKPLCPIRCDQQGVMTVDGPQGSKQLVWADTGLPLRAGDLPAGCRVDIDVFTGAVKPL